MALPLLGANIQQSGSNIDIDTLGGTTKGAGLYLIEYHNQSDWQTYHLPIETPAAFVFYAVSGVAGIQFVVANGSTDLFFRHYWGMWYQTWRKVNFTNV